MSISTVHILISPGGYLPVAFGDVWTCPELLLDAKDMTSLGHLPGRGGHMDLPNRGRTCCSSPLSDHVDLAAPWEAFLDGSVRVKAGALSGKNVCSG